jgi:hypothetical protein
MIFFYFFYVSEIKKNIQGSHSASGGSSQFVVSIGGSSGFGSSQSSGTDLSTTLTASQSDLFQPVTGPLSGQFLYVIAIICAFKISEKCRCILQP